MHRIHQLAPYHWVALDKIVEKVPRSVVRPIIECIGRLCDPHAGLPGADAEPLCRLAKHVGADPRSYREAARTLELLRRQIRANSQLDEVIGNALALLDQQGVTGRKRLLELARFFIAVQRRPDVLGLRDQTLVVGDEDLVLHDLNTYLSELDKHSVLWGPQAAALVLYPDTQQYGATSLPKVKTPLRRTLVVEEAAQVLIPGRSSARRWVRVDPIPAGLKVAEPREAIKEMDPFMELVPASAWLEPDRHDTLEVVYAGVRVMAAIVQPLWLSRLRLRVRLQSGALNKASYVQANKEISIWEGPLSAWAMVHELAHAVDDALLDTSGFASDKPGHPLNAFTDMVRPAYRDVAERRSRTIWDGLLKVAFRPDVLSRMRKGLVSLDDVVAGLRVLNAEERQTARELIASAELLEPGRVDRAFDRPTDPGAFLLLASLQEGLVTDDQGQPWIDIEAAYGPFRHEQLVYLLSGHEIFARFFDQYARLYFRQLGAPYGPNCKSADLEPDELARWVPDFHTAMVEAQLLDLGHIATFKGKQTETDTLVAGGLAALLAAIGADIVKP